MNSAFGDGALARQSISAAVEHLTVGGISRFEYKYIASRSGLDEVQLETAWPDRSQLLTAAWTSRLGWLPQVRDTGSLKSDLRFFATSVSSAVRTPQGRNVFRSSLPIDGNQEYAEVRQTFWDAQFETVAAMVRRADQRGELRRDVDHLDAVRMFCTAMYFDPLYFDAKVPAGYLDTAVEVFLHGVAKVRTTDSGHLRDEVMRRIGTREQDLLGAERPEIIFQDSSTTQIREAVLDAAIKEATLRGPEFVTIDVIAQRAGVATHVVERMWSTDDELLREAGERARLKTRQIPDTGDLMRDLLSFAESKANLISTPDARRNFLAVIPHDPAMRNSATVVGFWAAGLRESTGMLVRAQHRGDLRDGLSADWATRVVVVSLYYDLFFRNSPIRADYAAQTLDIFLNGIA